MTILIEAEAKEIAELLTLAVSNERLKEEKAATETAKEVKLEIWDGANWGRHERSTN